MLHETFLFYVRIMIYEININKYKLKLDDMKMRKFCILCVAACFCAGIVFTGCNKDDDTVYSSITSINAKVENGGSYNFDNVKAVMYFDDWDEYVVAEGRYTNGGFSINLPESVNQMYLSPIVESDEDDLFPGWLKISDETAKGGGIDLEGYKSGNYMGDFYLTNITETDTETSYSLSMSEAGFIYVDKNVTLKGSIIEKDYIEGIEVPMEASANAALKKGWNILYVTMSLSVKVTTKGITASGKVIITTKKPGGLKWYFEDDLGVLSMQKSYQSENKRQFDTDAQKIISKYMPFSKSKVAK